jgi:hypothetical protein
MAKMPALSDWIAHLNNDELVAYVGDDDVELSPSVRDGVRVSSKHSGGMDVLPVLRDDVNISPVLRDDVNVSPHDNVDISPLLRDDVDVSPVLRDDVNISPHDNVDVLPLVRDDVDISPLLRDDVGVSQELHDGMEDFLDSVEQAPWYAPDTYEADTQVPDSLKDFEDDILAGESQLKL